MVPENPLPPPLFTPAKPLGLWGASSLVIGNMIGTGVYFLPAALAVYGRLSLVGYLLSALGAICLAYVFSMLNFYFPKSGGPYSHGQAAFGPFIGFLSAWGYWIMNWSGNAATSAALLSYISTFVPSLAEHPLYAFITGTVFIWFFTAINCAGVKIGGVVQIILTALKLLPLLLIIAVSFYWFDPHNLTSTSEYSNLKAINASALIAVWSFIGLEAATVPAERISNPRRTVAQATIMGTVLVSFLCITTTIALFGVVPMHTLAQSSAPFATAAEIIFGPGLGPLVAICVVISGIGTLNGWTLVYGQVAHTMARDKIFPAIFLRTSKNDTPIMGLIIGSGLLTIIFAGNYRHSLLEQFVGVITISSLMVLVAYLISALAALKLLSKKISQESSPLLSLFFKTVCLLAIAYCLWAMGGAIGGSMGGAGGRPILTYCLLAYALGIPIFFYTRIKNRSG